MPLFSADSREGATVLAALRYWQSSNVLFDVGTLDIATDGAKLDRRLLSDEIDSLCEALHCGGGVWLPAVDNEGATEAAALVKDGLVLLDRVTCAGVDGSAVFFSTDDGESYIVSTAGLASPAAVQPVHGERPKALQQLIDYCASVPARDPGEGDWHDQESANRDGIRRTRARVGILIRHGLASIGIEAPAGKPVCPGCSRLVEDGEHDSDCSLSVWSVELVADGIQVTARTARQAEGYALVDLRECLEGWTFGVGEILNVHDADAAEHVAEDTADADLEVCQAGEPRGIGRDPEKLWTFTGTVCVNVRAATEEEAVSAAFALIGGTRKAEG